jgi:hypothetical protein
VCCSTGRECTWNRWRDRCLPCSQHLVHVEHAWCLAASTASWSQVGAAWHGSTGRCVMSAHVVIVPTCRAATGTSAAYPAATQLLSTRSVPTTSTHTDASCTPVPRPPCRAGRHATCKAAFVRTTRQGRQLLANCSRSRRAVLAEVGCGMMLADCGDCKACLENRCDRVAGKVALLPRHQPQDKCHL